MKWRGLILVMAMAIGAGVVQADPNRTLLTKENNFPQLREWELGVFGSFVEYNDNDEEDRTVDANQYVLTPQVRYQIVDDLALVARLPFGYLSPDEGDSEAGLGNLAFGLELRAHQDFFRFPWIIPNIMLKLKTADEKVRIDQEDNSARFGLSIGSIAWDSWTFAADFSYEFFADIENVARGGLSIVWDVNERFAFIAEGGMSDEDVSRNGESDNPAIFLGGLSYELTEKSSMQLYGGSQTDSPVDVFATIRYNHTF